MGYIFPRHRDAIAHIGDNLLLTCDINATKQPDFIDFNEMLESERFEAVDNVAICTPNYLHVPMVKACLAKGKRVLCEKPLGISVEEVESLPNDGSVFCVLQLRKKLPKEILIPDKVVMRMNFHRDDSYWSGWKGDITKSGGVLFNLGIHYFDYLLNILGDNYEIMWKTKVENKNNTARAEGNLTFGNTEVSYLLSIDKSLDIERTFKIDDSTINLSDKENLSLEDLHKFVYEDFKNGKGICPADAMRSIKLVAELKK